MDPFIVSLIEGEETGACGTVGGVEGVVVGGVGWGRRREGGRRRRRRRKKKRRRRRRKERKRRREQHQFSFFPLSFPPMDRNARHERS